MSEGIGARVTRKEDKRFITGKGKYTDDVRLHGMTYASFVRSPMPTQKSKALMSTLPRPCLAWWMY
jgi:carbon-monoxide dehydrogenase large subunit